MALAIAVPIEFEEDVLSLLSVKEWTRFEDLLLFRCAASGTLTTLTGNGIAYNAIGFMNNNSVKSMWQRSVMYDATGALVITPWSVNCDVSDVCFMKLMESLDYKSRDTSPDMCMRQFAYVASGPTFLPNQAEYGKRNLLRAMLLD